MSAPLAPPITKISNLHNRYTGNVIKSSANILDAGATIVVNINTIITVRSWQCSTKLVDINFNPVKNYVSIGTLNITFTARSTATNAETHDLNETTPLIILSIRQAFKK